MKVKKMYNDLLVTSIILNIFDSFLTFMAVFAIGYLVAYFYRLSFWFSLVPSLVFFIYSLIKKLRENKILLLEDKYPNFKERLRTSFDYKDNSNTILNELHSHILALMRRVDVNAFLSTGRLVLKVLTICSMFSLTLYLSYSGIDVLDVTEKIKETPAFKRISDFNSGIFDETRDEVSDRNKLSSPRLVQIGNKDLNISIETYSTELDINDIEDSEKNDFGGHYPEEIGGAAQETYEDQIPEEYKEVVKAYFDKINQ